MDENNIGGTVNLLNAMAKGGCKNIVFSSSATVYGDPATVPVKEDFPISATNPYAHTTSIPPSPVPHPRHPPRCAPHRRHVYSLVPRVL